MLKEKFESYKTTINLGDIDDAIVEWVYDFDGEVHTYNIKCVEFGSGLLVSFMFTSPIFDVGIVSESPIVASEAEIATRLVQKLRDNIGDIMK